MAERWLAGSAEFRTGMGLDAHRFVAGDHVWLCGIKIPHDATLEGHSDADAGLHALTDAILGAIGQGDIGQHFPPTDEKWRGAPSSLFLEHAAKLVREAGGEIVHCDLTLICERPKISPHRDAMQTRVAEILGIDPARVSIKATTTEGMGFTGRREGLAAQAIATVRLGRLMKLSAAIATVFGIGRAPVAPGTVASLVALILAWPIVLYGGRFGLLAAGIAASAIGAWAGEHYARDTKQADPSECVDRRSWPGNGSPAPSRRSRFLRSFWRSSSSASSTS